MLLDSYPFLSVMWTLIVVFFWVIWFWLLITVFADVFRRRDISGWLKAVWTIVVVVLPYIGVFLYLISQGGGMGERSERQAQASQRQFDQYVQSVANTGSRQRRSRRRSSCSTPAPSHRPSSTRSSGGHSPRRSERLSFLPLDGRPLAG